MENSIKLSDKELLNELSLRFNQNQKMLKQLEELNEKLIDSEMMKSHFLSNIKNEINNPISAILGLSQGIIDKKVDAEQLENSFRMIHEEAFSLNFQLKNIFSAAEIEAGHAASEISIIDVDQLILTICESFHFLANKKNVTLLLEMNTESHFQSDAQKLSTILSNLLSNAIKFSHEGGEVKIAAFIDEQRNLKFNVQDYGIGVAQTEEGKIYDRFKQLDFGTTKQFGGHGLGLSIVSSLVEILGGKIEQVSEIGEGCSFVVSIPEGKNHTNEFADSENSFLFFDEESNEEVF